MSNYAFTHLRHVDLAVPDYQQQLDFYTRQWGLTNVGTDGDVTYLAAEGSPEQYVVRIRKDSDKRLDLVSSRQRIQPQAEPLAHPRRETHAGRRARRSPRRGK